VLIMADGWHYTRNGKTYGPFTQARLQQLAAAGKLRPSDLFWQDGMKQWKGPDDIKGLFPTLPASAGWRSSSTRRTFLLGTVCGLGLGFALGMLAARTHRGSKDSNEDEETSADAGEIGQRERPAAPRLTSTGSRKREPIPPGAKPAGQ
jgi:hypothetical protein